MVHVHERLLKDSSLRARRLDAGDGDGRRIHVIETGDGPELGWKRESELNLIETGIALIETGIAERA